MKYFFKELTQAKDFLNGKITFDQGYINDNINSGKYNISVFYLPVNQFLSGWVMLRVYGLYFQEDIVNSIILLLYI